MASLQKALRLCSRPTSAVRAVRLARWQSTAATVIPLAGILDRAGVTPAVQARPRHAPDYNVATDYRTSYVIYALIHDWY